MGLKQIGQIFAAALSIRRKAQASRLIQEQEGFTALDAMRAEALLTL